MAVQKSHRSKSKKTIRNNNSIIKTIKLVISLSKNKDFKRVGLNKKIRNFI